MAANVAALHLVQTLMADKRPATAEDQKILAAWSSWGAQGLSQMFDETRPECAARRDELHELLTPTEYDAARRTTVNAHYTDPPTSPPCGRPSNSSGSPAAAYSSLDVAPGRSSVPPRTARR